MKRLERWHLTPGSELATIGEGDEGPWVRYDEVAPALERLATLRELLRDGVNELSVPGCVAETGQFCGDVGSELDPGPCPHDDVPIRACVCFQDWPCGDPECLGQQVHSLLFNDEVGNG